LAIAYSTTCHKKRFRDHKEAVKALHAAHNARGYADEYGLATRRREVRDYSCDECGGVHLTSRA